MAEVNGGGFASAEVVATPHEHLPSLDGFGGAGPEGPFVGNPELLLCAAFLGGLLLAGLVSRLGR